MSWPFMDQHKASTNPPKTFVGKNWTEVTVCVFHWLHGFVQAKKQNTDRKTAEDSFHNP
jgi:hypothetical protein